VIGSTRARHYTTPVPRESKTVPFPREELERIGAPSGP
jgi:hypothetical protein